MRSFAVSLALLSLFGILHPTPVLAEDAPQANAPAGELDWDTDRFWFASLLSPAEALAKLQADVRKAPRAEQRVLRRARARDYTAAFRAAGQDPALEAHAPLYRLHLAAEEFEAAAAVLHDLIAAVEATSAHRDEAGMGLAQLLVNRAARDALGEEGVAAVASTVRDYLSERSGEGAEQARAGIRRYYAMYEDAAGDSTAAIRQLMLMAMENPSLAATAGRSLMRALQGTTHDLDGYEAVRAGAAACLPVLRYLARQNLAKVQAEEEPDASTLKRAEAGVRLLEGMGKPIAMLGRDAPDWTTLKAYGDVVSLGELEGKVVVLDFWATWCPWCIKSFPAIRDLLRDYGEEGLVVVGVTAPASAVYEHRYDLDDDLQEKADPTKRAQPVARLARGAPEPDAEVPLLSEDAYRVVEQETLAHFVKNHQMTWPVVMIDPEEPAAKYALGGWPHAVVIDRQGRVRYFKSGALLRDRPEAVAAFRKVLEDLLAEPAK